MRRKLVAVTAAAVAYAGLVLAAVAGTSSSSQSAFQAGPPTTRIGIGITIVVTTTTLVGDCPGEPNRPDGEDPWGGCFPGPESTGVPDGTTLTAYSGPTTPAADAVIDSKLITDCLSMTNPRVTITNSRVEMGCQLNNQISSLDSGQWTVVEDSEVICTSGVGQSGVGEWGFILRRVEITGCENGIDGDNRFTVEDSYIHNLDEGPSGDGHGDGIQTCCLANVTVHHNSIIGQSAAGANATSAMITPSTGGENTTIDHNFLAGGAYTLYCPETPDVSMQVVNNVFADEAGSLGPEFGYADGCGAVTTFTGNVTDLGTPVTP